MDVVDMTQQRRRRLRLVRWVALCDAVLLAALLFASFTGAREWVSLLGPLHGGNFLLLLTVVGVGAADGLWGWWFLLVVVVTAGPIGALVGEWIIARQMAQRG
ncbi:MAG: hypothetical protein DYG89_51955 [Caldilinea sp. CFX5]|nr:hypothetical protein [Caldilinea sp. CFX5]